MVGVISPLGGHVPPATVGGQTLPPHTYTQHTCTPTGAGGRVTRYTQVSPHTSATVPSRHRDVARRHDTSRAVQSARARAALHTESYRGPVYLPRQPHLSHARQPSLTRILQTFALLPFYAKSGQLLPYPHTAKMTFFRGEPSPNRFWREAPPLGAKRPPLPCLRREAPSF